MEKEKKDLKKEMENLAKNIKELYKGKESNYIQKLCFKLLTLIRGDEIYGFIYEFQRSLNSIDVKNNENLRNARKKILESDIMYDLLIKKRKDYALFIISAIMSAGSMEV